MSLNGSSSDSDVLSSDTSLNIGENEDALAILLASVAIVIPSPPQPAGQPPRRPRVIRVPIKFAIKLEKLGLAEKFTKDISIHGLSIVKIEKIKLSLTKLGLALSYETQVLLNKLALARKEAKEISTKQLKVLKRAEQSYIISSLALASKILEEISLAELSYLDEIRAEFRVTSPDLYKVKTKEVVKKLKKYIEILDLIEGLDKPE